MAFGQRSNTPRPRGATLEKIKQTLAENRQAQEKPKEPIKPTDGSLFEVVGKTAVRVGEAAPIIRTLGKLPGIGLVPIVGTVISTIDKAAVTHERNVARVDALKTKALWGAYKNKVEAMKTNPQPQEKQPEKQLNQQILMRMVSRRPGLTQTPTRLQFQEAINQAKEQSHAQPAHAQSHEAKPPSRTFVLFRNAMTRTIDLSHTRPTQLNSTKTNHSLSPAEILEQNARNRALKGTGRPGERTIPTRFPNSPLRLSPPAPRESLETTIAHAARNRRVN